MAEDDLEYTTSSPATPSDFRKDVDQNNTSILVQQLKDLDKEIAEYNTFDSIVIPKGPLTLEQKAACFDQMAANSHYVTLLRSYRGDLNDKIERLRNG